MTKLTLEQLCVFESKTEQHQISMALLAEYYEKYLMPRTYRFELDNGTIIDLKFERKDFCHLVGIPQTAKVRYEMNVKKKNPRNITLQMYSGVKGFKRVRKGKIEFSDLRKLHSGYYAKEERYEKVNFFHFMDRLLTSSNVNIIKFVELDDSKIKCEFLFHNEYDGALLHLGIEKEEDKDNFFPKTFFRYYIDTADYDKFIKVELPIAIKNRSVI